MAKYTLSLGYCSLEVFCCEMLCKIHEKLIGQIYFYTNNLHNEVKITICLNKEDNRLLPDLKSFYFPHSKFLHSQAIVTTFTCTCFALGWQQAQ